MGGNTGRRGDGGRAGQVGTGRGRAGQGWNREAYSRKEGKQGVIVQLHSKALSHHPEVLNANLHSQHTKLQSPQVSTMQHSQRVLAH